VGTATELCRQTQFVGAFGEGASGGVTVAVVQVVRVLLNKMARLAIAGFT